MPHCHVAAVLDASRTFTPLAQCGRARSRRCADRSAVEMLLAGLTVHHRPGFHSLAAMVLDAVARVRGMPPQDDLLELAGARLVDVPRDCDGVADLFLYASRKRYHLLLVTYAGPLRDGRPCASPLLERCIRQLPFIAGWRIRMWELPPVVGSGQVYLKPCAAPWVYREVMATLESSQRPCQPAPSPSRPLVLRGVHWDPLRTNAVLLYTAPASRCLILIVDEGDTDVMTLLPTISALLQRI